jgi:serine protease inhibitor
MSLFRSIIPVALLLAACGDPSGPPEPLQNLPRQLTVGEQQIIQASNTFSFDLLKQVRATESAENVFLSPLSASMSLGMVLNGAAGNTFEQMRSTLRFGQLSQAEINASYRGLLDLLLGLDKSVEITIANSTWARKGTLFVPAFFTAVRQSFDAEARELDFSLPTAKDTINAWVRTSTRNRIPSIIDQIDPLDILFVINAIYFKGNWTEQFEKSRTRQASFRLDNGTTVQVQMMSSQRVPMGWVVYPDGVVVAELPYGRRAFNMVVVLPPPNTKLADFVAGLEPTTWTRWMTDLRPIKDAHVELPRFTLEYEKSLNATLKALGMTDAFDPQHADLSKLTTRDDAYITYVKQKTFLKVDEVGTEAAAVTVSGVGVTSAPPGIRVDRPFLVAIREKLSGTILFIGAIGHPRE